MNYTHEFSLFPDQIMTRHHYQDVNDTIASVINQIKALQRDGKYSQAARYINEHKSELGPYVLGSENLNTLDEETRNIEIYAKGKKQQIYYQEDEPVVETSIGDVWLGLRGV